jgi:hypothetical protein
VLLSIVLNYLAFQSFDFDRTWWKLFQKRVVRTKFDIYVLLSISNPRDVLRSEGYFDVIGKEDMYCIIDFFQW